MEAIWDWGIQFIKGFQTITCAPLDWIAFLVHYGFNVPAYLLIVSVFMFCVDFHKGFAMGQTMLISVGVNGIIKHKLAVPRPFQRDPSVFRITETGFSTPSGHSQTASTVLPLLAWMCPSWKKVWRILLATLCPLIIAVSRTYLGVHYPTDVLAGLLLGYIFSIGYMFWGSKLLTIVQGIPHSMQTLFWAMVAMVIVVFDKGSSDMAGAVFGMSLAYYAVVKDGGLKAAEGLWWQKLLRTLIGLGIFGVLYLGMKALFPSEGDYREAGRFIRYMVSIFCGIYYGTLLSVKLRLAERETEAKKA